MHDLHAHGGQAVCMSVKACELKVCDRYKAQRAARCIPDLLLTLVVGCRQAHWGPRADLGPQRSQAERSCVWPKGLVAGAIPAHTQHTDQPPKSEAFNQDLMHLVNTTEHHASSDMPNWASVHSPGSPWWPHGNLCGRDDSLQVKLLHTQHC